MKKYLLIALISICLSTKAQQTPTNKTRSNNDFSQVDNYLIGLKRLGIPTSETDNLDAASLPQNTIKLIYNTTLGKLRVYNPVAGIWADASPVDLSSFYTKDQVDEAFSNKLNLSGGQMSGPINMQNGYLQQSASNTVSYLSSQELSFGTDGKYVSLRATPGSANYEQYLQGKGGIVALLGDALPLTGGEVTGPVQINNSFGVFADAEDGEIRLGGYNTDVPIKVAGYATFLRNIAVNGEIKSTYNAGGYSSTGITTENQNSYGKSSLNFKAGNSTAAIYLGGQDYNDEGESGKNRLEISANDILIRKATGEKALFDGDAIPFTGNTDANFPGVNIDDPFQIVVKGSDGTIRQAQKSSLFTFSNGLVDRGFGRIELGGLLEPYGFQLGNLADPKQPWIRMNDDATSIGHGDYDSGPAGLLQASSTDTTATLNLFVGGELGQRGISMNTNETNRGIVVNDAVAGIGLEYNDDGNWINAGDQSLLPRKANDLRYLKSTGGILTGDLVINDGILSTSQLSLYGTNRIYSGKSLEFYNNDNSTYSSLVTRPDGTFSIGTGSAGGKIIFDSEDIRTGNGIRFLKEDDAIRFLKDGDAIANNSGGTAQAADVFISGNIKTQGVLGIGGTDANAFQLYTAGSDAFVNASLGGSVSVQGYDININAGRNVNISAPIVSTAKVTTDGDIEITDTTKGIILKSPNGTKYRVTINDAGDFVKTAL